MEFNEMKPSLPVPEPIVNNVPGTWAYDTVTRRLPQIVRQVWQENELDKTAVTRLQQLIDDIAEGTIRPLHDSDDWNQYIIPYQDQSWLD